MVNYDLSDPVSIFEYSKQLLDKSLHDFAPDYELGKTGKGTLGQLVEMLFFHYAPNSNPTADFQEAGLELKCTPLKHNRKNEFLIKERLVCNMINYCEVVNEDFEHSHFYLKSQLMLLLFYLHQKNANLLDLHFIFSVLWRLPEKDLLIIRNDYYTIINKIRDGKAHLLSEGDTLYLGACRKGQKGDKPQSQPFSDNLAPRRAFSLKTAYMRTILDYVKNIGEKSACNFDIEAPQLVTAEELKKNNFERIILDRFSPFVGKNVADIFKVLDMKLSISKSKYSMAANGIVSSKINNIENSEEFMKAGIKLKTVRVQKNGNVKESMSFKNIDYCEVASCDNWEESELFEIFSSRFMFVIFRETGRQLQINDRTESEYVFEKAFFWTMPTHDLHDAEAYWNDIKANVSANRISSEYFYKLRDKKKFHVRPKATNKAKFETAVNPNGGLAPKYCYWFNAEFVKTIIENN